MPVSSGSFHRKTNFTHGLVAHVQHANAAKRKWSGTRDRAEVLEGQMVSQSHTQCSFGFSLVQTNQRRFCSRWAHSLGCCQALSLISLIAEGNGPKVT